MYTRCRQTKELVVVGYSVLNVFVASGSDQQPATDSSTIPVCFLLFLQCVTVCSNKLLYMLDLSQ